MSISKKDLFIDDRSGIDYVEGNRGPAQRKNSTNRSRTPTRASISSKDGKNFREALMAETPMREKGLTISQHNSASNPSQHLSKDELDTHEATRRKNSRSLL